MPPLCYEKGVMNVRTASIALLALGVASPAIGQRTRGNPPRAKAAQPVAAQAVPATEARSAPAAGSMGLSLPGTAVGGQAQTPDVQRWLAEAARSIELKDFEKAYSTLDKVAEVAPQDQMALTLRGAALTYEKRYDEAADKFRALVGLQPEQFGPQWNLAEVEFLKGKFAEARDRLLKIKTAGNQKELVYYKVFLTLLFEGKKDEARQILDGMKWPSDTAGYYFAHAAWEFFANNPAAGMSWVQEAQAIFDVRHNMFFADALIQKGYLKTMQAP